VAFRGDPRRDRDRQAPPLVVEVEPQIAYGDLLEAHGNRALCSLRSALSREPLPHLVEGETGNHEFPILHRGVNFSARERQVGDAEPAHRLEWQVRHVVRADRVETERAAVFAGQRDRFEVESGEADPADFKLHLVESGPLAELRQQLFADEVGQIPVPPDDARDEKQPQPDEGDEHEAEEKSSDAVRPGSHAMLFSYAEAAENVV